MRQVGIMGGTFDPIHNGHLVAAETARDAGGLDEVWFIPSAVPPLKEGEPAATGGQRLEMVRRAIDAVPYFRVLDIELKRGGVSYSIDTVEALGRLHPDSAFTYIIGADRINDLTKWRRIEELAGLVSFIGLERPGYALDRQALPAYLGGRLTIAAMPQLAISSSAIRERRAEGRSVRFLVPDSVYDYMVRNDLYGP